MKPVAVSKQEGTKKAPDWVELTDEEGRGGIQSETSASNGFEASSTLRSSGATTPEETAIVTGLRYGIPYINLRKQNVDKAALELVPESVARKYGVVPLSVHNGTLAIAIENPENLRAIQDLGALTKKNIEPVIATPQDIREATDLNYRASGEIEKQLSQIPRVSQGQGLQEQRVSAEVVAQAPIVRALDLLIKQGVRDRASDIHIEPEEDKVRIRFRIDGILHDVMSLSTEVHAPLISRIKIMAGMNIAERRRPQDGQITFNEQGSEVDIRVATSNTVQGEMAVLRILDKSFAFRALTELGFRPDVLKVYERMLATPFGMILISGPTGSGKTTTLYGSVNQLDSVGRKIVTIEDPVEYRFSNICQMQVNSEAGVTFASGLRATMRLDPDVLLVGEIRDSETAQIAIQAALTGHLVLSSVHANDTAGVIYRLIDLGVEPFLVVSAVVGIVAQRMVRRICPYCSRPVEATPEERLAYEEEIGEARSHFIYGAGCNLCANTGYQGRTGIYEVMKVSEEIRRMILGQANADDIRRQAFQEGMTTVWHDGMLKVKMGSTTPYEVIRNIYSIG